MSAALIAAPMWLASNHHDTSTDDDSPTQTITDVSQPGPSFGPDAESVDDPFDRDEVRTHRVRHGLTQTPPGPRCMVPLDDRQEAAVDRARSIVDETTRQADDSAEDDGDDPDSIRIRLRYTPDR